jgi:hypothetical protein
VERRSFQVGDRVKRGPTWEWDDNQDRDPAGNQTNGTIQIINFDGWVTVQWDGGKTYSYPGDDREDIVLASDITQKTAVFVGCQHPRKRASFIGPMIGMINYCPDCKQEV